MMKFNCTRFAALFVLGLALVEARVRTVRTVARKLQDDLPQLTVVFPLKECQGDCDRDVDCAEGLVCMRRRGGEAVPGCDTGDFDLTINTDFCVKADTEEAVNEEDVKEDNNKKDETADMMTEMPGDGEFVDDLDVTISPTMVEEMGPGMNAMNGQGEPGMNGQGEPGMDGQGEPGMNGQGEPAKGGPEETEEPAKGGPEDPGDD